MSGRTLIEKVKVEVAMKQPIADIGTPTEGSGTEMVVAGLTSSVWRDIPMLRDRSPFVFDPLFDPEGHLLSFTYSLSPVLINTRLVKPADEPRSYYDLLDPKWKGKIVTNDPRTTGGGSLFYYLPRYLKVLDLDYYRRLAQQDIAIWGGTAVEAYALVARGEFAINPTGTLSEVYRLITEGAPVKPVPMKEGVLSSTYMTIAVKNPPHPNATRLFITWIFSPEGQRVYGEAARAASLRKDIPDFSPEPLRLGPVKILSRSWDSEQWAVEDRKAGTMEKIFGKR